MTTDVQNIFKQRLDGCTSTEVIGYNLNVAGMAVIPCRTAECMLLPPAAPVSSWRPSVHRARIAAFAQAGRRPPEPRLLKLLQAARVAFDFEAELPSGLGLLVQYPKPPQEHALVVFLQVCSRHGMRFAIGGLCNGSSTGTVYARATVGIHTSDILHMVMTRRVEESGMRAFLVCVQLPHIEKLALAIDGQLASKETLP